jgi:EXS family
MVRPMQDIAFTLSYIVFGLQGWWANGYFSPTSIAAMDGSHSDAASSNAFLNAADASVPAMERSWLLHTAILPACMISPLWWRFLQNMRQTYDAKQRWPYLGNALKYFAAAQVAMVGVYQPHMQQNTLWLLSFVGATLYQVRVW